MKVGLGADHGGFEMKQQLAKLLTEGGHEVIDFGNTAYDANDDYPDLRFLSLVPSRVGMSNVVYCCAGAAWELPLRPIR